MARSLPNLGVPVLFLSLLVVTGCDNMQASFAATGPAPLVVAANVHSSFGVESSSVAPEFHPSGSCIGGRWYGARVGIRVHGNHDVILRGFRFSYLDRFRVTSLPTIIPIPTLSTPVSLAGSVHSTSPVSVPGFAPLPRTTLIPIPGSSPIEGVVVSAGSSHMFPYFVNFGCGAFNDGVIIIIVDAGDRDGKFSTSELRVAVSNR